MGKIKIALTLLFSALGIFGANEYYKPRNIRDLLKWRGVKLASDTRAWKSMFFEHEKELDGMGIKSEDELWGWCSERFKQGNLSDEKIIADTKKFCADNPISIMARIIRDGEEGRVIKKDDHVSFSINYILSGRDEKILELLAPVVIWEADKKDLEVGKALGEWCEKQKKENITSTEDLDKFGNFKKRCYSLGVTTISQLLSKEKLKVMKDIPAFLKRFKEELQYAEELKAEIEKIKKADTTEATKSRFESWAKQNNRPSSIIQKEIAGIDEETIVLALYYKHWCSENLQKKLFDTDVFPNVYVRVKYRCTEKLN